MIIRQQKEEIRILLEEFPAIAILGPRQVGKTTLAKELIINDKKAIYFDLELKADVERLTNAAFIFDQFQDACIILDEVQRDPDIFKKLRPAIDKNRSPGRFILTGSASPALVKGVSESLAGRIAYTELSPINLMEATSDGINQETHWFKGGFPFALTSKSEQAFGRWAENFIRAYIERDLSLLFGVGLSAETMRNFWYMLAAQNGGIWTAENYAKALGVSSPTVTRYLDFLLGAYMVRRLPAWYVNVQKRVVKAPKVYIRDSGLLHIMNRIYSAKDLPLHLTVGGSWEGYVIEQIYQIKPKRLDMYYYRTHNGAECDLLLVDGITPLMAIEIKYSEDPSLQKGFYNVLEDLSIHKAFVITPGIKSYQLNEKVSIYGLQEFLKKLSEGNL